MTVVINARGTSLPYFCIGKQGTTIYQGEVDPSLIYQLKHGDLWINPETSKLTAWDRNLQNWKYMKVSDLSLENSTVSSPADTDILISPGDNATVRIMNSAWPSTRGSSGQVLTTDGAGQLSWSTLSTVGTVTSVSAESITPGISISGSPITGSGTLTVSLVNDMLAVENLSTTGIAVRTATDTWATRSITGTESQILVSNGDAVTGNPVVSISPNPVIPGSESISIPVGTIEERPGLPVAGNLRFNSTLDNLEIRNNEQWVFFKDSATMQSEMEPTGFAVRTDSIISFNDPTRTFSISPRNTSYTIYNSGRRFVKSTTETVQIPNVSGSYYLYFDANGVLTTFSSIQFAGYVFVSYIYWNAVTQTATVYADERHGMTMDSATHSYLHNSFGTQYISGLLLTNYTITGTGSSASDATVGITGGVLLDKDLQITIVNSATPTNQWEQTLAPVAKLPIIYKSGTVWTKDVATDYPVKRVTNRAGYNQKINSQWQVTEASADNYYVSTWIISTNDVKAPVVSLMGQIESSTMSGAIANASITTLDLSGFPFVEFKILYRLIYKTSSAFTNSVKSVLVDVADMRGVTVSSISVPVSVDHSQLAQLSNDDHQQYLHVSVPRTVSATHTFNPSAVGTPFNLGPNAVAQMVPGLNSQYLNGLTKSDFQLVNSNLTALSAIATNGIYVKTGTGSSVTRSLTGTASQISVSDGNGVLNNPVISISPNPVIPGTEQMIIPTGISETRPASPVIGMIRGNTTLNAFEFYNGSKWVQPTGAVLQVATGSLAQTSFNTVMPYGSAVPTITNGTEVVSVSFTPKSSTSTIIFSVNSFYTMASSSDVYAIGALFDNTSCMAAFLLGFTTNTGNGSSFQVQGQWLSGSTATRTLSFRAGPNTAATMHMAKGTGTQTFGGAAYTSGYIIWEIA